MIFTLLIVMTAAVHSLTTGNHTLHVTSKDFGTVARRFLITHIPLSSSSPPPIVLGLHGQSNSPESWGPADQFTALAKQHGWLMVFPAAIWEKRISDGGSDSTWNCGTQDDDSVCVAETTGTQCLESCHKLGKCRGRCNWATCHNDLGFIDQLLSLLESQMLNRFSHSISISHSAGAPAAAPAAAQQQPIFLVGESNGGMFIHHLIQEFPGRFLAAAPAFGLPLLGYMVGSQYQLVANRELSSKTSILQLHDRSDTVIPWQGGKSAAGWLYESLNRSLGVWSSIHGCQVGNGPVDNNSSFNGGPTNVRCRSFEGCEGQHSFVGWCMYDGNHGEWPEQPRGDNLVANFFLKVLNDVKGVVDVDV